MNLSKVGENQIELEKKKESLSVKKLVEYLITDPLVTVICQPQVSFLKYFLSL